MTFRDFLKLEGDGFSLYGNPKVVNPVTNDIKTTVKLHKAPKSTISKTRAGEKKSLKPARPAGLHGSSSMTIKSVV